MVLLHMYHRLYAPLGGKKQAFCRITFAIPPNVGGKLGRGMQEEHGINQIDIYISRLSIVSALCLKPSH